MSIEIESKQCLNAEEMRSPEDLSTRTPQERFFWLREYYQTAINRGNMGGTLVFGRLFSEEQDLTELTHAYLDEVGRRMNEHWVGNDRNRQRMSLPASSAASSAATTGKAAASKS